VAFSDLRGFIEEVDKIGQLKIVEGADWRSEIGALTFLVKKREDSRPCYSGNQGLSEDFRILANPLHSLKRLAMVLRMPVEAGRWNS